MNEIKPCYDESGTSSGAGFSGELPKDGYQKEQQTEALKQPETLQSFVEALDLEYTAEFIPLSRSRNAVKGGPKKSTDLSLNWKVRIKKAGVELVTDYMQGIGHLPGYKPSRTRACGGYVLDDWKYLTWAVEYGKYCPSRPNMQMALSYHKAKPIPAPALHDVLWSLSLDAEAIDYTFEDWANTYGYDIDRRKAEKIYKQCLEIGLTLRRMLGDKTLADLRAAAQDY